MSKHTPGPWSYTHNNGSDFDLVGANGEQVVSGCGCCGSPNLGAGEEADARLIAAAPDLLSAQTMGANMNTPDFLDWLAERLVHVYGESSNVDFVLSLKARSAAGRAAIEKATGEQP